MTFTRQDATTFAIGLGAGALVVIGQALITLDSDATTDLGIWTRNLATGLASATGRYLVTELAQRGFRGNN